MNSIKNGYIDYLNSLHNVSANSSNALAESQALSEYFPEIYEPLDIAEHVFELLDGTPPRVVILTGHAGDGKSTVALDIFKRLKGIPPNHKLLNPLKEMESIGNINIIKDMSELSAEQRLKWISESFKHEGSWLVVSNTGPLLSGLLAFVQQEGLVDIESRILQVLNQPLENKTTNDHRIDLFDKELVILNLTRLDNIQTGSKLLSKLVRHSAWKKCNDCSVVDQCPIKANQRALLDAIDTVEVRVRWLYSRLNVYEHRLTLRQIVAQLSFGITGGISCEQIQTSNLCQVEGLEKIVFSESFFGMSAGKRYLPADGIHAISLMSKAHYGSPAGVEFDRELSGEYGMKWGLLPSGLMELEFRWRKNSNGGTTGTRWRYALRRMAYLFGKEQDISAEIFFDTFLESTSVRDYEKWRDNSDVLLTPSARNKLIDSCLDVLLEFFTGFSANQFQDNKLLYLTLRRKDKTVVQPTQLVIHSLAFREFKLEYDKTKKLPKLVFRKGDAELLLSLPLMDYIQSRRRGEIGSELSPIYQSQIDWFHSDLIAATKDEQEAQSGSISLIKSAINGKVTLHKFILESGVLEVDV